MITFTVTLDTTNADTQDQNAAKVIVTQENNRRAALDPPGDPLPLEPNAALLASYQEVLETWTLPTAHNSYRQDGENVTNAARKEAFKTAPENVQNQVDALLEPYLPTP